MIDSIIIKQSQARRAATNLAYRFAILFLLFAVSSYSQIYYSVNKTTVLSAAAEVITVQQPVTAATVVRFVGIYIDSTAAVNITVERNGTAASATSLAVNNVNPGEQIATTGAYSSSNVGAGTVITRMSIPAGGAGIIDLSKVAMIGSGTNKNLTIRTSSITGTVNIVISYYEII